MSARQRSDRALKAVAEGRKAFIDGLPIQACPYQVSNWGIGAYWQSGWRSAQSRKPELDKLATFAAGHGHEVETDYSNDCIRVGIQWINSSQGTTGVEWMTARNISELRNVLGY